MKIIRHAVWFQPSPEPEAMLFYRECDVIVNLEDALKEMKKPMADYFVSIEVYEMPGEPPITTVSMKGIALYYGSETHRSERDQAGLYYYEAMSLGRLGDHGVLFNTVAHPLTSEQIAEVFRQLAAHPAYKLQQKVLGFGTDYHMVTLQHGEVTIDPKRMDDK